MQFSRKNVNLPTGEVQYVSQGTGPPLLCLHPASGLRITAATEKLAERFTIFMPIFPGFDGTPVIEKVAGMEDLASLIGEFVEVAIGHRVNVTGHSFGGWVACWLSVIRPDLVARLVLQCPAGFRPEGKGGLDGDPAKLLQKVYAHPEKRRPETKPAEVTEANRRLSSTYSAGVASDHELIKRLDEIKSETLILHGRKDGVIPEESPQLLERKIPQSTVAYIDDAAHNIEVDQPEEYVRLVTGFLDPAPD